MITVYVTKVYDPAAAWCKEYWVADNGYSFTVDHFKPHKSNDFFKYEYMYEDTMYAFRYY